jgi:hypothetical protein
MGLGLCIVGLGLLLGLSYNNLRVELAYLVAGLLFFGAGRLLERRKA